MGGVDIGRRRAANVHASQHGGHGPGLVIDFSTSPGWTGNSTYPVEAYLTQAQHIYSVVDTEEGQRGHAAPRSPRPNFAVAKVFRIQAWKTRF